MIMQKLTIAGIPAIIWGEKSPKLFIAVHGNMSNKMDTVIASFAEKLTQSGFQVLSFDLPEHGERKNDPTLCKVQECVKELAHIMEFAKMDWEQISLFACSMGAYFSLLAYPEADLKQCLFLSPVVDMERIINNMMTWFNISEAQLRAEKQVETPIGQPLYWDYYCYVKEHPIDCWNKPTAILYGSEDDLCDADTVLNFTQQFNCELTIMEQGEHYFHTEEQLEFFRSWIETRNV
ncbi:alpha/beta hydrolase [Acetobacterium wieringae]|uniref:Alpha/beta hydrolase n=1 Tax=Acetobacterium wieringae TaxID=52694 RepID=A0A5D0WHQ4_9FIRM|nr:alpha/beta hydrolase [Acetobacterium wieringae]TYC83732.1 alpha/beta hydrolase [Acetobacterium wieringae]